MSTVSSQSVFTVVKDSPLSRGAGRVILYKLELGPEPLNLAAICLPMTKRNFWDNYYTNSDEAFNVIKRILNVVGEYFMGKLQEVEDGGTSIEMNDISSLNMLTKKYKYDLYSIPIELIHNILNDKTDEELLYFYIGVYNTKVDYNNFDEVNYSNEVEKLQAKGKKIYKYLSKKRTKTKFDLANIFDERFIHLDSTCNNYHDLVRVFENSTPLLNDDANCIKAYQKLALLSCEAASLNRQLGDKGEVKLKDYDVDLGLYTNSNTYMKYNGNLLKMLPASSPKFAKFILDVKVSDILEASQKIGTSTTVANAIQIIEEVRESDGDSYTEKDCMINALELSTLIQKKMLDCANNYSNHIPYLRVTEDIYENHHKYWGIRILIDYFREESKEYTNDYDYYKNASKIISDIIAGPTNGWFKGPTVNSENIVRLLYENFDAQYIIKLIDGIRNSNRIFTEKEWRSIIESSDMYADAPVEWVLELI